jgi:hypothetical protein
MLRPFEKRNPNTKLKQKASKNLKLPSRLNYFAEANHPT